MLLDQWYKLDKVDIFTRAYGCWASYFKAIKRTRVCNNDTLIFNDDTEMEIAQVGENGRGENARFFFFFCSFGQRPLICKYICITLNTIKGGV